MFLRKNMFSLKSVMRLSIFKANNFVFISRFFQSYEQYKRISAGNWFAPGRFSKVSATPRAKRYSKILKIKNIPRMYNNINFIVYYYHKFFLFL